MPRGSDKHSPRQDEHLEHDIRSMLQGGAGETRAQEGRTQEGEADDEPTPDAVLTGDRGRVDDDVLDHEEVEARSRLAAFLRPSVWPADRAALVECARQENAPGWVLDRLSTLP